MFTLKIDTDNAAFEADAYVEITRILNDVARALRDGYSSKKIYDLNGNLVGEWKLRK